MQHSGYERIWTQALCTAHSQVKSEPHPIASVEAESINAGSSFSQTGGTPDVLQA